jgi:sterol 24-C-methyltransferase
MAASTPTSSVMQLKSRIPLEKEKVQHTVDEYSDMFEGKESGKDKRRANYTTMVNNYYDVSTDFYEYGWGLSFHFAVRHAGETLRQSIARHELYLALRLNLKPGMKVLDVGCGVGGPLMEIARFSGADITGVNNNDYQIGRGQQYVKKNNLEDICHFLKADFMHIPMPDNSFDAIYAIEATCHAPNKVAIYSEIFRLLKPGCYFAGYEWCMTDKFDPNNPEHLKIKRDIEIGDALPDIDTTEITVSALKRSGFEVLESKDLAYNDPRNPVPWYEAISPSFSWEGFRLSSIGRMTTGATVSALEFLGILPKGCSKAHSLLQVAIDGLLPGGQTGIFTPMFFFVCRKPEASNGRSTRSKQ